MILGLLMNLSIIKHFFVFINGCFVFQIYANVYCMQWCSAVNDLIFVHVVHKHTIEYAIQ